LARGHASSQGRNYITMDDLPIVIHTVFSTASLARVRVFELLLEFKGEITTSEIVESLNISDDIARRTMTELQAIGL
jgi:predicted DNA-binding transcriptional regulator